MKDPRCLSVRHQLLALVASCAFLTPLGFAADSADTAPQLTPPTATTGLDVDFPGGTVAELVAQLRGKQVFNLVGEKTLLALKLPAFSVRNVDPQVLAWTLSELLRSQGATIMPFSNGDYSQPVFVLQPSPLKEGFDRPPRDIFMCFAVSDLLDTYSAEQIAGALRTAWELNSEHKPEDFVVKFHPETRLLFVTGRDHPTGMIAEQVIGSLRQDIARSKERTPQDRQPKIGPPPPPPPQGTN